MKRYMKIICKYITKTHNIFRKKITEIIILTVKYIINIDCQEKMVIRWLY